ncbi:hypothetical protein [Roseimicrobium sp. ORNL1]|uniref:hypothetical protein n=1 Tax=Roseimicrobium sp. ORNL1 TaxID=2711231 RepID=UPI0013E168EF|nr:hypothetical protein [Roseimicrobium sp. ORNL1]QIF01137.1 hypothetical protein G5S37_06260 [Roseimicrobium sp. ORNL1]
MRFWTVLAVWCLAAVATANPIVPIYPAYISSERLEIEMGQTAARVSGQFHFATAGKVEAPHDEGDVHLNVPIWLPENPKEGDQTVADFYATFRPNLNILTAQTRPIFDRAFDFQLRIDGRPHAINGFSLADVSTRKSRRFSTKEWLYPGFTHVLVYVTFDPKVLKRNPLFQLSYRQPLRLRGAQTETFYVPTFEHLPEGHSTGNLDRYSLSLKNPGPGVLSALDYCIPARSLMTLPLIHGTPIHVICKK